MNIRFNEIRFVDTDQGVVVAFVEHELPDRCPDHPDKVPCDWCFADRGVVTCHHPGDGDPCPF